MPANTNWSEDVAEIVYDKCSGCHHTGGIGPFNLTSYNDAVNWQNSILLAINTNQMPPWPPDTSYAEYAHPRVLTNAERLLINDWVTCGAPEGDPNLAPPAPVFNSSGPQLGTPDVTLSAPVYASNAGVNSDDYVCFTIPTNLATDKWIQAVEVEPGNPAIVHHCLVFVDDQSSFPTDTIGGDCVGPTTGSLIGEFTPGSKPIVFPNGQGIKMGVNLPAGANIVLAMHYPEGSQNMIDSTKVHLYFYPDNTTGVREISINSLIENWSFWLPPGQVTPVQAEFPPNSNLIGNWTILGVFPHMHLIGHDIMSYGVNPGNDTVPFVRIPDWDFEWQGFYYFDKPKKMLSGGKLYGFGNYDNTINNPHNPNNPPQIVTAGLNTTDEMFLVYFQYLPYQPGDENLNMEDLITLSVDDIRERSDSPSPVLVYPNPARDQMSFLVDLASPADVQLEIMDMNGRIVNRLVDESRPAGAWKVQWDGTDQGGTVVPGGVYFYRVLVDKQWYGGKLIWAR